MDFVEEFRRVVSKLYTGDTEFRAKNRVGRPAITRTATPDFRGQSWKTVTLSGRRITRRPVRIGRRRFNNENQK